MTLVRSRSFCGESKLQNAEGDALRVAEEVDADCLEADALLTAAEDAFLRLDASVGSIVRLPAAELSFVMNLGAARDLVMKMLRDGARDRVTLLRVFAGDCVRISRLRAMLDAAQLSQQSSWDPRLGSCRAACETLEHVLADLGFAQTLRHAQNRERERLRLASLGQQDAFDKVSDSEHCATSCCSGELPMETFDSGHTDLSDLSNTLDEAIDLQILDVPLACRAPSQESPFDTETAPGGMSLVESSTLEFQLASEPVLQGFIMPSMARMEAASEVVAAPALSLTVSTLGLEEENRQLAQKNDDYNCHQEVEQNRNSCGDSCVGVAQSQRQDICVRLDEPQLHEIPETRGKASAALRRLFVTTTSNGRHCVIASETCEPVEAQASRNFSGMSAEQRQLVARIFTYFAGAAATASGVGMCLTQFRRVLRACGLLKRTDSSAIQRHISLEDVRLLTLEQADLVMIRTSRSQLSQRLTTVEQFGQALAEVAVLSFPLGDIDHTFRMLYERVLRPLAACLPASDCIQAAAALMVEVKIAALVGMHRCFLESVFAMYAVERSRQDRRGKRYWNARAAIRWSVDFKLAGGLSHQGLQTLFLEVVALEADASHRLSFGGFLVLLVAIAERLHARARPRPHERLAFLFGHMRTCV